MTVADVGPDVETLNVPCFEVTEVQTFVVNSYVEPDPEPIVIADAEPERLVQVVTDGDQALEAQHQGSDAESAHPAIIDHVEPPAQGGARSIRCEGCGSEIIGTDERRLIYREDYAHVDPDDITVVRLDDRDCTYLGTDPKDVEVDKVTDPKDVGVALAKIDVNGGDDR